MVEIDNKTGWRYEYRDIGVIQHAKKENTKRMKVYLEPSPHIILSQNVPLRGWYKGKYEDKGVRPRPCYTEALLTQPYGGTCPVNCLFCYVNNGVRGYRSQNITVVDPDYPNKIEKQLQKMKYGISFYISSFTEPFQPLEKYYHNTERLARLAVKYGLPLFFLSRQVYPDWAIDLLTKNKYSYAQFSINTPDELIYHKMSPRAAKLPDLFECIKELKKKNIYVSIQCNPIVPGIVSNDDLIRLIHKLKELGVNHIIFKFAEIVSPSVPIIIERLGKVFPKESVIFEKLFTETIGGLRTIREDYRINTLNILLKETKKVGLTMGLCYEYTYVKDKNGKILDKTGVSLGERFTTAPQCHGMRIPMFYKNFVTKKFEPFELCPDSGCLYCEEACGKFPPCGSRELQRAKSLKHTDYNKQEIRHELADK